jgi:hypothetical protein
VCVDTGGVGACAARQADDELLEGDGSELDAFATTGSMRWKAANSFVEGI